MMELQGAIGIEQLKKLAGSLERHRRNKAALKDAVGNILGRQLSFREIPDPEGDTGDALVFFLDTAERAKCVARNLQQKGIGFKNLPDALRWHFAGTWDHILARSAWLKGRTLENYFGRSGEILRRAIAFPILYKMDESRISKIAVELQKALAEV